MATKKKSKSKSNMDRLEEAGVIMSAEYTDGDKKMVEKFSAAEVTALVSTQTHQIEVEDAALALLRFRSGAIGTVVSSTAVFPGFAQRLEISGTRGTVVIEDRAFVGGCVGAVVQEDGAERAVDVIGAVPRVVQTVELGIDERRRQVDDEADPSARPAR